MCLVHSETTVYIPQRHCITTALLTTNSIKPCIFISTFKVCHLKYKIETVTSEQWEWRHDSISALDQGLIFYGPLTDPILITKCVPAQSFFDSNVFYYEPDGSKMFAVFGYQCTAYASRGNNVIQF